MKKIMFVAIALSFLTISCHKKDNSPAPVPPEVVCDVGFHKLLGTETCVADATPTPTPEPSNKTITCGGFEIGGEKEFVDLADLIAHAQVGNGSACLNYHEKVIYYGDGFGPCIECTDITKLKFHLEIK